MHSAQGHVQMSEHGRGNRETRLSEWLRDADKFHLPQLGGTEQELARDTGDLPCSPMCY